MVSDHQISKGNRQKSGLLRGNRAMLAARAKKYTPSNKTMTVEEVMERLSTLIKAKDTPAHAVASVSNALLSLLEKRSEATYCPKCKWRDSLNEVPTTRQWLAWDRERKMLLADKYKNISKTPQEDTPDDE